METTAYLQQIIERNGQEWIGEIKMLSKYALSQPHAAYSAFTHGLSSRWNYLVWVTDWEVLSAI